MNKFIKNNLVIKKLNKMKKKKLQNSANHLQIFAKYTHQFKWPSPNGQKLQSMNTGSIHELEDIFI